MAGAFTIHFEHTLFDIEKPVIPGRNPRAGFVLLERGNPPAVANRCARNGQSPALFLQ